MNHRTVEQETEGNSLRPLAGAWQRPDGANDDSNGPSAPGGANRAEALLSRPVFESFTAVAQRQPHATAVQVGARRTTYGTLLAQAEVLATRIDAETSPGAVVATLLANSADAARALLACLAAGRPCISLNPNHPPGRLADIIADAGVGALVLADETTPCALPAGLRPIRLNALKTDAPSLLLPPILQDGPCLVVYTSGSTGRPKGIVRSERQMLIRVEHRIRGFKLGPADRTLLLYPLSTGPGLTACLAALLSGGELHVAGIAAIGARGVLDVALGAGITSISSLPVLLRMLLALDGARAALATVRSVFTTSEAVLRSDIERWRAVLPPDCAIRTAYGLTEGSPLADWFLPPVVPGDAMRLPVGYPLPWHDFAITDPAGAAVPIGEPGELWVRGRLLSLGEWRQGTCVPGRLMEDPDDPCGAILRTGDLVRRRVDGLLEFLGRVDEQIRIRGNRVEPAELDYVLRHLPGVADAAILVRRATGDPVLVAFVVSSAADDSALRDAAIRRLGAALPGYMMPTRLHVVAAVPKLPSGKLDRDALALLDDSASAGLGLR